VYIPEYDCPDLAAFCAACCSLDFAEPASCVVAVLAVRIPTMTAKRKAIVRLMI
jgi:hypothetical protein